MTNLSRLRCSHKSMGQCLFLLPRSFKVLSDNLMRVLCTARRQLFKYSHKYSERVMMTTTVKGVTLSRVTKCTNHITHFITKEVNISFRQFMLNRFKFTSRYTTSTKYYIASLLFCNPGQNDARLWTSCDSSGSVRCSGWISIFLSCY